MGFSGLTVTGRKLKILWVQKRLFRFEASNSALWIEIGMVLGTVLDLRGFKNWGFADSKSCSEILLESSKERDNSSCASSAAKAQGCSSLPTKGLQKWFSHVKDSGIVSL